jgi:3-methyl-2-oxobutanoate hydroxymethyltransferase
MIILSPGSSIRAGIDVILVGDSASNVMAGHETTLPITLDQMIYHASSVVRGAKRCLMVVDLPFGSYQSNGDIALASAIRIMKETGAHAIKLEGGAEVLESVKDPFRRHSHHGASGSYASIDL